MAEFDAHFAVATLGQIRNLDGKPALGIGNGRGGRRAVATVVNGIKVSDDAIDRRRTFDSALDAEGGRSAGQSGEGDVGREHQVAMGESRIFAPAFVGAVE